MSFLNVNPEPYTGRKRKNSSDSQSNVSPPTKMQDPIDDYDEDDGDQLAELGAFGSVPKHLAETDGAVKEVETGRKPMNPHPTSGSANEHLGNVGDDDDDDDSVNDVVIMETPPKDRNPHLAPVTINEHIAELGLGLLHHSGDVGHNSFLSPVSVSCVLAMVYAGATGNTKQQMQQALFDGIEDETLHAEFGKLMQELNPVAAEYKLRAANRIYAHKSDDEDFELLDDFKELLQKHYQAMLHLTNFKDDAAKEKSCNEINKFVSDTTDDKIQKIIDAASLVDETRLVLINAIYFKGDWRCKFEAKRTEKMPFYLQKDIKKKVNMMVIDAGCSRTEQRFWYRETDDAQVLGMDYKGKELMFVAILPKIKCGLQDLEVKLGGKEIIQLISGLRRSEVNIFLPKFKLEKKFDLNGSLAKLGMPDMFQEFVADFGAINGKPNDMFVSKVVHKAFVEINEEGSEAAAATVVMMSTCCSGGSITYGKIPTFRADHPFLFMIVDHKSFTPLFMGRYTGN